MRMRLVFGGFCLALLLTAMPASAQTGALVSAQVQVFMPGVDPVAGSPLQTSNIPLPTGASCAQPPFVAPPGTPANPTRVVWTDPANNSLLCVATQGTFLMSVPVGLNYFATLTFTDDLGRVSPRSAASNPFIRVGPLGAPTGVQVRP